MKIKETVLNSNAGEFIRRGGNPYGIVPFELLECRSLPPVARLVAVWIESKPDGWVVHPSLLQKNLGLSEKLWLSARRAMISAGIFTHNKFRKADGKWGWKSEFDITPILSPIPPLAAHGEPADIKIRDKELRNKEMQYAEDHSVAAIGVSIAPPKPLLKKKENELNEFKKLHIGYVLNKLEIEWYESGDYVYWDDKHRARKSDDGHWLWLEVNGKGETECGGSAIDLIMCTNGDSQAKAISFLRLIYQEASKNKK